MAAGGREGIALDGAISSEATLDPTIANPWNDAAAGVSRRRSRITPMQLNHRLSFDEASGIITLPDNEDWLIEDIDTDFFFYDVALVP